MSEYLTTDTANGYAGYLDSIGLHAEAKAMRDLAIARDLLVESRDYWMNAAFTALSMTQNMIKAIEFDTTKLRQKAPDQAGT